MKTFDQIHKEKILKYGDIPAALHYANLQYNKNNPLMRCFLITYHVNNRFGNIEYTGSAHPSKKELLDLIKTKEEVTHSGITLFPIHEFKSLADCNKFKS